MGRRLGSKNKPKININSKNGTTLTKEDKLLALNALRSLIPGQYVGQSVSAVQDYGLEYYGIPRYPTNIDIADYKWMYRYNGLAKRIVDIYPAGCWQEFPTIREGVNAEKSEFESKWEKLIANPKLKLPFNLLKVDKISGIGRFGILYLGFDDGSDTEKPVSNANDLLYIRAFDESSVSITDFEQDSSSERYGQPTFYQIQLQDVGATVSPFPKKIHWTRVLHVVEDTAESEIYGEPRLQSLIPQIIDISLLLHGSTHMYIRGGFPGISFEAEQDAELTEADAIKMRSQIEDYFQSVTRYLTTQGVKAKSLSVQVANPEPYIKAQMEFISATTGIPSRMLAGSEQAQLASQQDRANFNDRVHARQENYVTPGIVLPFIERLQSVNVLPMNTAPINVEWAQTDLSSKKEKAEISELRAKALAEYSNSPIASMIMPKEQFFSIILGCSPEEIKNITDAIAVLDNDDVSFDEALDSSGISE